jgi:hypothetical protein
MMMGDGMFEQGRAVRAVRPGSPGSRRKTFGRGRACSEPGCSTTLSIYNAHHACWQHAAARPYYPKLGRPSMASGATSRLRRGDPDAPTPNRSTQAGEHLIESRPAR